MGTLTIYLFKVCIVYFCVMQMPI